MPLGARRERLRPSIRSARHGGQVEDPLESIDPPLWSALQRMYPGSKPLADRSGHPELSGADARIRWRAPPEVEHVHRISQRIGLPVSLASLFIAGFGSLLACEIVYLSALVWHLAVAAMGFVLLVFGFPGEEPGAPRLD